MAGPGLPSGAQGVAQEADFVGRLQELEAIGRCRAEAALGMPWMVVVEGEPGIGKTALAQRALAAGPDMLKICWSACDRSEQDYPYGVVDQILSRLPGAEFGAQRPATAPTSSPFAVGTDLLTALAGAAESGPLAVVIDDIPWADEESLKALSFVLRRLYSEPILTVITARTQDTRASATAEPGVPAHGGWHTVTRGAARVLPLRLIGLSREETAQMAAAGSGAALSQQAVGRLWEHTAGHPLYLRSLLAEAGPQALANPARPLPVPSTLNELVRRTLNRLPAEACRLVQALAVLDTATPLATAARLAGLTDATAALDAALAGGLLQWQPEHPTTPLRIHHQLQRDAIYQAISPTHRHALHAAAATMADPDRAWDHLVAAAVTTDPELADRLSAEATRQTAQGRHHRAATLQLWAADLSSTRDTREHHLITAATHLLLVQALARAQTLREAVESCAPTLKRDAVLGYMAGLAGDLATADRLLAPAAETADPATREIAATWLGFVHILRTDGRKGAAVLYPVVGRLPSSTAAHYARGALALSLGLADGPLAGLVVMAESGLSEPTDQLAHTNSPLLMFRGLLRVCAGVLGAGIDDLATLAARQRADSNLSSFSSALFTLSLGRYLTGRWAEAAVSADHALMVAETVGQPWGLAPSHAVAAMAYTQQGHHEQAASHLVASRKSADWFPEYDGLFPVVAAAVAAQARADWPAMREALQPLNDPAFAPGMRRLRPLLWTALYVEALTATDVRPTPDDLRNAETALAVIDRLASGAPALAATHRWLHGRLAAARGDTETALQYYREGLETPSHDGDDIPLHRAFLHHDLARHFVTVSSPDAAARHLEQAHNAYTALGAAPHAQRAAHELTSLRPTIVLSGASELATALTEREHAVAQLAADGLTNNEIARTLFVSPKTVEYHLSHVYTKLRLTSRRQLRDVSGIM